MNTRLSVCRKPDALSASEYLEHQYEIPEIIEALPLADEPFVSLWQESSGRAALDFLTDEMKLPAYRWTWENPGAISVSFAQTLGGKLPVIATGSHRDFRQMEALLSDREEPRDLPLTVNAFAMQARAESIFCHRILLLNRAPYSNIPAERLKLSEDEWLERSHRLRLRHECAHYETLRLLGGMRNHALDEILADALGQIAAFGSFDAARQRLFFGLEKGEAVCTGRLFFYCRNIIPEERPKVYRAVDEALDAVSEEIAALIAEGKGEAELLLSLADKSIAERIGCSSAWIFSQSAGASSYAAGLRFWKRRKTQ